MRDQKVLAYLLIGFEFQTVAHRLIGTIDFKIVQRYHLLVDLLSLSIGNLDQQHSIQIEHGLALNRCYNRMVDIVVSLT